MIRTARFDTDFKTIYYGALWDGHPDFIEREIVLADKRDGKPLADAQGPLSLIVPGEKVHARWVRQVKSLEIVRVGTDEKP
jgi:hypothetical protein